MYIIKDLFIPSVSVKMNPIKLYQYNSHQASVTAAALTLEKWVRNSFNFLTLALLLTLTLENLNISIVTIFERYLSEPGLISDGNFNISTKNRNKERNKEKLDFWRCSLSNYHVIWRVEPLINEVSKVIWVNEHQFAASHTTIV